MAEARPATERFVFAILILAVFAIAGVYIWKQRQRPSGNLPVLAVVPDFTLTNQLNEPVSLGQLRGEVWLADIIFTRCAGPCPRLTTLFADLSKRLKNVEHLRFVSLTADPSYDHPEVLAHYGMKYGAEAAIWWFLTGTKADINRLAVDGLKLALVEKSPAERQDLNDLFIHSTAFALVDKRGRIRGFFQGLEPDSPARIEEAIRVLAAEP